MKRGMSNLMTSTFFPCTNPILKFTLSSQLSQIKQTSEVNSFFIIAESTQFSCASRVHYLTTAKTAVLMVDLRKSMENWSMHRKTCPSSITKVKFIYSTDYLEYLSKQLTLQLISCLPLFSRSLLTTKCLNNCILCFTFPNAYTTLFTTCFLLPSHSDTSAHTFLWSFPFHTTQHKTVPVTGSLRLKCYKHVLVYARYQA